MFFIDKKNENFWNKNFISVSYIKSVDGLVGCYRGLGPKLVGNIVSTHFSEHIADKMGMVKVEESEKDDMNEEEYYKRFETQLKRNIVVHAAGAVISSPFHVISIRMMAQFVGRETKYSSILGSIVQIYKDEGILGFFTGVIPRLLFDVTCVVAASTATYLVGRHFIREKEGRAYFGSLSSVRFGSAVGTFEQFPLPFSSSAPAFSTRWMSCQHAWLLTVLGKRITSDAHGKSS